MIARGLYINIFDQVWTQKSSSVNDPNELKLCKKGLGWKAHTI